jgi:ABC-type multidrug transport system fused ATPase/permease subunit
MSKIKLILSLLSSREKKQLFFVVFALLIMGLVEIIGVGSLSPFMAVISNREIIHTNVYLNTVYVYFNFASDSDFIIAFGIAIILVMALGNGCLAGVSFLIRYYTGKRFYSISTRLFEKYLRQPYIFYLNANTADLSKTLLGDTLSYISGVLLQFLQLVSNSIISVFIILLLIAVNPLLSALISALFILSYVSVFSLVRNFLSRKALNIICSIFGKDIPFLFPI